LQTARQSAILFPEPLLIDEHREAHLKAELAGIGRFDCARKASTILCRFIVCNFSMVGCGGPFDTVNRLTRTARSVRKLYSMVGTWSTAAPEPF
jgi:hypothetical protein